MDQQAATAWVPDDVDPSVPSAARVYDFLLGGSHNFAVDRMAAEAARQAMPGIERVARLNRAFLGRVVRFMLGEGIRQFLDLGSGIPTVGPVHQIAQANHPDCRVVYVDRERIAVAHSELMLGANDHAAIVHADFRRPDDIFGSPQARQLLRLDEPVGVLMLALLHYVPDEADPAALVAEYCRRVPVGSYLAISHLTSDQNTDKITAAVDGFNRSRGADQATPRSYAEIETMFGDTELVAPGLVGCGLWRPAGPGDIVDDADTNAQLYGGVARKAH
ncbi:SAM-dependent methyltransferase [Kibdelosporangium persicum]|uniref:SAM-dependent methyltransferase n=1 Tax=Kibdelosporangium persicum TaxID=2698649 RepID=UPI0015638D91|nr:SAM-dependent methyltransferase [Kibdelosporangium persicum]